MTIRTRIVAEKVVPGKRLGRNVEQDSRNADYPALVAPIGTVWHPMHAVPLGQGDVRACVGYTMANLMMTDPFWTPGRNLVAEDALRMYSKATELDNIKHDYPAKDTGTTTLGASKALVELGYVSEYRHAETVEEAFGAIQLAPLFFGTNWYDSFDETTQAGEVVIDAKAKVRGGHAVELVGLDVDLQRVWGVNPWGPTWGLSGLFWMSFDTFERLMIEDGDATQFVPQQGEEMDEKQDPTNEVPDTCPECGAPLGAPPEILLESRRWSSRRWSSPQGPTCGTCGAPILDSRRWSDPLESRRWSSRRWSSRRWSEPEGDNPLESRRWSSRRWSEEPLESRRWSSRRWSEEPLESRRWSSRRWSEEPTVPCPICGREFVLASALQAHMDTVHG